MILTEFLKRFNLTLNFCQDLLAKENYDASLEKLSKERNAILPDRKKLLKAIRELYHLQEEFIQVSKALPQINRTAVACAGPN